MKAFCIAMMFAVTGCGLGIFGDESGGGDNLPTQGAGPYGKPDIDFETPADEPYVLEDSRGSLVDPSALWRDDGGFRLWMGRVDDDAMNDETDIYYAELPAITELADRGPELVMSASDAWEGDRVARPCVIELDDGSLVMFYEGGDGHIGRADSSDGISWTKHPSNPVLSDATNPGAAYIDDGSGPRWVLFVTQPGMEGIFRADSSDGVDWTLDPTPAIVARPLKPDAFDPFLVTDPFVIAGVTEAGRAHFGLFFSGHEGPEEDDDVAIGYAGSFDAVEWERFGGADAVLAPGIPGEHGPTVVLDSSTGVMFFHEERQGQQRIAVATHP
jgi:hypothetical protein